MAICNRGSLKHVWATNRMRISSTKSQSRAKGFAPYFALLALFGLRLPPSPWGGGVVLGVAQVVAQAAESRGWRVVKCEDKATS